MVSYEAFISVFLSSLSPVLLVDAVQGDVVEFGGCDDLERGW
ncbi:hypothetical protein [Streptomyces sp. NPDC051219]